MAGWWERDPGRWASEQQALEQARIRYEREPVADLMRLKLELELDGQRHRLIAHFPSDYPSFPPAVAAPDLALVRHQTPGSKMLCLLRRGGDEWQPGTDTLAGLLLSQLPHVFASQPGNEAIAGDHEAHEGVPITGYITFDPGSFVGFPAYAFAALTPTGTFRAVLESVRPLRGTVFQVLDSHGQVIASADATAGPTFEERGLPIVTGRWIRLGTRPEMLDAKAYYALAAAEVPSLERPSWQALPGGTGARVDLVALLFQDELAWQGWGGNVILVSKSHEPKAASEAQRKVLTRVNRAELESQQHYFVRDPAASGLQQGIVCQIGAGSVGSPAAKLMAQAGLGRLRLIDHDVLDAGNAIRWELGRGAAGYSKVQVLQSHLSQHFPYCRVGIAHARLGDASMAGTPEERQIQDLMFRDVSCLLDTSASVRVAHFLSEQARRRGIPYLWAHATNGAWGGLVGYAGPNQEDFCWECHLHYLNETQGPVPPLAAAPEAEFVQPAGCMDPTFVGAQADLMEVSLMGARATLDAVLHRVGAHAQRAHRWNLATLRLRDDHGRPQLPVWTPHTLAPHAACPNH
ncbi:MAG TPA: ThiF family adenylyltransferase [Verrucomicrobiae bacterium]|nr:ThiF family adenylyltransferase [Verrucomicrobiae bacterium]